MTEPFEHLIRSTLTDLAEEAPIVHDQLSRAERRVRNRRRVTVTVGAVSTLAAILIATPLALAATGSDEPPPAVPSPAGPAAVPSPPVPTPSAPTTVPTVVPSPGGAPGDPSITPGPPGVPGRPTVSPTPSTPPGPPGVPGRPTASPSPSR
ncbi:hypothetical protein KBX08_25170 [Micromonospora sp. H61]|uniref:hypothetical protein n=1 Tax=Micromonospora sp. H61 TaxID=2824888 RepID=UPI001B36D7F3|nr:hypothetical protein [Micromonospora sp. H61]MBQ0993368.1 hypothetical protein [Micromonospora sp. H61]